MIKSVIMPKLGETMEEGKIISWKKNEGETVKKGEILLEVSTDKANFEVESPYDGILLKILVPAGEQSVPVTTDIAYIGDSPDEKIPEVEEKKVSTTPVYEPKEKSSSYPETPPVKTPIGEGVKISPLAKRLALEKGVDITKVKGTGPGGRITEKDINDYLKTAVVEKGEKIIILTGIKKIVAERLSLSKKEIPHFYLQTEIDMTECIALRSKLLETISNVKITYTDIIISAVSKALSENSEINATFDNGKITIYSDINIGFAVAVEDGLVVPVIKKVDQKTFEDIAKEREILVKKAREKKLSLEDMQGGTFTVSNLGMYDVDVFTAIINPPQVAILAVGKIKESVVAENGKPVVKNIMKVTGSFDHRAVDGTTAAKFLSSLKNNLEKKW